MMNRRLLWLVALLGAVAAFVRPNVYRNNGEHWYVQRWSLLKHLRVWLVWIGGWERPNHSGWQLRRQQIGYVPARYRWNDLYPLSFFGHRLTFQSFGFNIRFSGRGYLCFHKDARHRYAYFSPNATPWAATLWLYGTPPEVVRDGDTWEREFVARQAEYKRKDQETQQQAEQFVKAQTA